MYVSSDADQFFMFIWNSCRQIYHTNNHHIHLDIRAMPIPIFWSSFKLLLKKFPILSIDIFRSLQLNFDVGLLDDIDGGFKSSKKCIDVTDLINSISLCKK
jgi:hypothetical protein